jgi:hypothetical protein
MHAAYLLLRREVFDALAKPTEGRSLVRLAGALVDFVHYMLFFGWQRTITLRRWHRFAVASDRICRAAGRSRDGTRQGFDLTTHNV